MTQPDAPLAPQILPLGMTALVVRFADVSSAQATSAAQAFKTATEAADLPGVAEVAAALCSVLVQFDPAATRRADLIQRLETLLQSRDWNAASLPPAVRRWQVPVHFGGDAGPQLAEAASLAHCTPEQAIADVTGANLRVLTIGFAPGQPYLGLLPERWNIPRQTELTPKVPAGALVIAVRQLVLFANPSVTGWRQIGLCGLRPFLQSRAQPFALRQGDALRFVAVSDDQMAQIMADNADGLGGARCEVLQ